MKFAKRARSAKLGSLAVVLALAASGCQDRARNESIKLSSEGEQKRAKKDYEDAIRLHEKATSRYRDNHVAWWGLGHAYKDKGEWKQAANAFEQAVRVDDKQAMYHMWLGISLYEKALKDERERLAKAEGKQPDQVKPDVTAINADQAITHLSQATKLNADLWRAHYHLGRIYRDQEKAKEAADELTKAITLNPRRDETYIALAELYMRWDYLDQAVQVAAAGAGAVQEASERGLLQYELGMAYYNKRLDDKAIAAFSEAIKAKKDLKPALFQRGQAYFRKGDFANAKTDLEDFQKAAGTLEFEKGQASKMLLDIAAKQR